MSERELLVAVLEHAIIDATDRRPDPRAEYWLREPGDEEAAFSCSWVCANLGIDAARVAADLPGIAARLRRSRKKRRDT